MIPPLQNVVLKKVPQIQRQLKSIGSHLKKHFNQQPTSRVTFSSFERLGEGIIERELGAGRYLGDQGNGLGGVRGGERDGGEIPGERSKMTGISIITSNLPHFTA